MRIHTGKARSKPLKLLHSFYDDVTFPGDKPFKCPECNLSFRTTGHRQSHLKSHRKAAQANDKADSIDVSRDTTNKRKPKVKSTKQVNRFSGASYRIIVAKQSLVSVQVTSEDIDTGTHMAKVIAITGDLSSHHNSLGDQTGSLANMTVKFHLDEAGNVQVIYIFQYYY